MCPPGWHGGSEYGIETCYRGTNSYFNVLEAKQECNKLGSASDDGITPIVACDLSQPGDAGAAGAAIGQGPKSFAFVGAGTQGGQLQSRWQCGDQGIEDGISEGGAATVATAQLVAAGVYTVSFSTLPSSTALTFALCQRPAMV